MERRAMCIFRGTRHATERCRTAREGALVSTHPLVRSVPAAHRRWAILVAEPQRALRFATGGTLDYAYCTGLGKMLMSVLADDEIDAHLPESEPYASWTPHTLTTRAEIVADLERIRETGRSIDGEERNRGVTCMAVLLPTDHAPALALSVSAPSGELDEPAREQMLPVLTAAAAELVDLPGFDAAIAPLRTRMALA